MEGYWLLTLGENDSSTRSFVLSAGPQPCLIMETIVTILMYLVLHSEKIELRCEIIAEVGFSLNEVGNGWHVIWNRLMQSLPTFYNVTSLVSILFSSTTQNRMTKLHMPFLLVLVLFCLSVLRTSATALCC
ncbi:uncharacterized protein [Primulina eburnea]|uniref:uncharacterized protein n=1 Tax=Primulina eburnea TaxID=1245227 RepID=UPI003C6C1E7A